jgi:hypothetical protein
LTNNIPAAKVVAKQMAISRKLFIVFDPIGCLYPLFIRALGQAWMSFDRRSPLSREPEEKQERAVEPHYVLVGQTPDPIAEFCARHGRDLVLCQNSADAKRLRNRGFDRGMIAATTADFGTLNRH